MRHRIAGLFLVGSAVYCLWLSVPAFVNGPEMTNILVDLGSLFGQSIDRADPLLHWRIAAGWLFLVGVAGLVAGASMFLLKRWSYLLVSVTAIGVVVVHWLALLTGYIRYGFESQHIVESLVLLVVAAVGYLTYLKWTPNAI